MTAMLADMQIAGTGAAGSPAASVSKAGRPVVGLITPWYPEPVDNGSKIRLRHLIDTFAAASDLVVVALLPDSEIDLGTLPPVPGARDVIVHRLPEFHARSLRSVLGGLAPIPRSYVATWDEATAASINRELIDTGVQLVVGADLRVIRYLQAIDSSIPVLLDEANVSPFVAAGGLRGSLREQKYRHLVRSGRRLDAVVVPSQPEAEAYRALSTASPLHVIHNGAPFVPEQPWSPTGSSNLLFTGSLTYAPNREAAIWYATFILPLLSAHLPSANLFITGKLPEDIPPIVCQPGISLTGLLDRLEPVQRSAGVFVAPIFSGTGTRTKILEAMAMGMPVVTTTKGCEGLNLVPDEHAIVADTPEAFTLAILHVLGNPDVALALGQRGREFVLQHGTWKTSREQFSRIVDELLVKSRC